jgi:ABC-type multidrug transport system fused ATPase/permease subunit
MEGNFFTRSLCLPSYVFNSYARYGDGTTPIVPAPVQSIYLLLMDCVFYAVLTWYFDAVLPNEFGYSLHPLFFLSAVCKTRLTVDWSGKGTKQDAKEWQKSQVDSTSNFSTERDDKDVRAETYKVLNPKVVDKFAVQILHLRKKFKEKSSVKDLCLSLEEGELFALLGQNGAGKTTTMNMLCGLTRSTSGDALIHGYSVRSQMHVIRKFMGVCPQV